MKQDLTATLFSYIDSLHSIIYVNHFDPHIIDDSLKSLKNVAGNDTAIEVFDNALGRIDFENRSPSANKVDLVTFLKTVRTEGFNKKYFLLLLDIHESLERDKEVIALLKRIATDNLSRDNYNVTVFILSSRLIIPPELERYITVIDVPIPDASEIISIINEFCATNEIIVDNSIVDELAILLKGLDSFQINQVLCRAYQDGGNIGHDDNTLILQDKKQIIKKAGMLEFIETSDSIESIGGLKKLKYYLRKKSIIFQNLDSAIKFGVDVPKGILILGMPGCGKSLTAKATATLFKIPLLRLEVGRLLGKYVGESEENMARALRLAEAVSPCVLWIDEIEKAFSGISGDGGASDVTTRLFGQFLTWMQEKNEIVYIVATANDVSKIPPEFYRKGRFDELFFVDLPDEEERREILRIHLEKRKKNRLDISISNVVKKTDGYSGADIEGLVKEAIEAAFLEEQRSLTTDDLIVASNNAKSITELMGDKLEKLRDLRKKMNFQVANQNAEENKKYIQDNADAINRNKSTSHHDLANKPYYGQLHKILKTSQNGNQEE